MAWPLVVVKPSLSEMGTSPQSSLPDPVLRQFADRLIELRKQRGVSQERLAMEASVGRSYLSGVERAQRNISLLNICKLAAALGVEPYCLLEGVSPKSHPREPKRS